MEKQMALDDGTPSLIFLKRSMRAGGFIWAT
jgi:hypothetical protein